MRLVLPLTHVEPVHTSEVNMALVEAVVRKVPNGPQTHLHSLAVPENTVYSFKCALA
jgi:hypothetical protein